MKNLKNLVTTGVGTTAVLVRHPVASGKAMGQKTVVAGAVLASKFKRQPKPWESKVKNPDHPIIKFQMDWIHYLQLQPAETTEAELDDSVAGRIYMANSAEFMEDFDALRKVAMSRTLTQDLQYVAEVTAKELERFLGKERMKEAKKEGEATGRQIAMEHQMNQMFGGLRF